MAPRIPSKSFARRPRLATITIVLPACLVFAPSPSSGACPRDDYDAAVRAAKSAQDALDALDKDPRKPARSSKNLDADKKAADTAATEARSKLNTAKEALSKAEQKVADYKNANTVEPTDRTADQLGADVKALNAELESLTEKQTAAIQASRKFDSDEKIFNNRRSLEQANKALADKIAQFTPAGTTTEAARERLRDTSYRQSDPAKAADADGVLAAAKQLLEFKSFGDAQADAVRKQVQESVNAAGGIFRVGGDNPWDQLRKLGPKLIAEIDRCRDEVDAANREVVRLDLAIDRRKKEIDAKAAEVEARLPDLNAQARELSGKRAKLNAQIELKSLEAAVTDARKPVTAAAKDLATALTNSTKTNDALRAGKDWDGQATRLAQAKTDADAEVTRAKAAADAEDAAKAAALTIANTGYAAVEADLATFKAKLNEDLKAIKVMTDRALAGQKLAQLKLDVKAKKLDAVGKLEAIEKSLGPFRKCYTEVEAYVTNTLDAKLAKLRRGRGELAVSDMEDPNVDLLDIPTDAAAHATLTVAAVPDKAELPLVLAGMQVVSFGDRTASEVDAWIPFKFAFTPPPDGVASAQFILVIRPIGQLIETDTFHCADADGQWATLFNKFTDYPTTKPSVLKVAITAQSHPKVIAQLNKGLLRCCVQDDTALFSAKLVINPPADGERK